MANHLPATDARRVSPALIIQALSIFISVFHASPGISTLFRLFWLGKFLHSTIPAPSSFRLTARTGQHRPFPAPWCIFPHLLQNRVPRGERAPVARKLRRRSRLPPRSVPGAPHRGAAPEATGETESFRPCHKTGGNTGFLPVVFFHMLHAFSVNFYSDTGFSHLVLPVLNRFHLLQHPKRTRFCLFRAVPGAFRCFCPLLTCKILRFVFCALPLNKSYYIAVCNKSFLKHGWWFLLSGVFFNHQHYSRGCSNVHPYVSHGAEKNHSAFWWFYTSYVGQKAARYSTREKVSEICHNPYSDTVGNGSTLGKLGIHDPQLNPKALKPTPNFLDFDPLRKARIDRLYRAL